VITPKHQDVALCEHCLSCSNLLKLGQDSRLALSTLTLWAYKRRKGTWNS